PPFFGIKPKIIIKGGFIAYSLMGDVNASIPTTEPVYYRPMFGAMGETKNSISVLFTSKLALRSGLKNRVRIGKKLVPVRNCRRIGKQDMVLNSGLPKIEVDPESFIVRINGEIAETKPSRTLALSRLYNLF
ncbi:MAG: urease subunit alpha, partial [Nitrososphaeraceae archaeon]